MTARIFKPAKNAMQSGTAKTREWQLDYEPEQPRAIEPLMGWTSSGDMKQQLTLRFDTKEDAVAYCEREGIPYQVIDPKEPARRQAAYADNFAFRRGEPGPTRGAIGEGRSRGIAMGSKVPGCLRRQRNDTMMRAPMPRLRRTINR